MRYNTQYRYHNSSSYLPTGVKWLLISNVAIFLLYYIAPVSVKENLLMLSLAPVMVLKHFAIWQLQPTCSCTAASSTSSSTCSRCGCSEPL